MPGGSTSLRASRFGWQAKLFLVKREGCPPKLAKRAKEDTLVGTSSEGPK